MAVHLTDTKEDIMHLAVLVMVFASMFWAGIVAFEKHGAWRYLLALLWGLTTVVGVVQDPQQIYFVISLYVALGIDLLFDGVCWIWSRFRSFLGR